jgi:urease accessory protein UreE
MRVVERTAEEFLDAFSNECKVYRIRHIEADGHTVRLSRLYRINGSSTLRMMSSMKRQKLLNLPRGFLLSVGDMVLISEDGTTSIVRKPQEVVK